MSCCFRRRRAPKKTVVMWSAEINSVGLGFTVAAVGTTVSFTRISIIFVLLTVGRETWLLFSVELVAVELMRAVLVVWTCWLAEVSVETGLSFTATVASFAVICLVELLIIR